MGELNDRRARKKAQTRAQIRAIAHRLFAERGFETVTIADIAAEADVAVQTVFNHFATKEELFYDGRAEWVDATARAVRTRAAGVPPLTALREHLMAALRGYLHQLADPEFQCFIATLEASPALSAYERELHHRSVRTLSQALVDACQDAELPGNGPAIDPRITAPMTAAIWMAGIRALLIEQRSELTSVVDAAELSAAVEMMAAQLLEKLEWTLPIVEAAPRGGAPTTVAAGRPTTNRRAG